MLSVAKLTPGQETYYERSVAAGIDDYYAGRGESPGIWVGTGAAELGLHGIVSDGRLGVLIRGDHPRTGERLRRRHPKARTITVERIDRASGTRRLEEKTLRPVAGFDLVFSVPKSVSLLHALGDDETRRVVNEAHAAAWHAALAYLEDEACVVRRGTGGLMRERASGFVAAAYQHRTSRAQDPHLHTHVVVANMALRPSDGKWRAVDGEAILKTYRLAAGYLYQAHLRAELSRSLGVEWDTQRKGMAELRGVPRTVIAEFSTRRAQVVEHLRKRATAGFYAAQRAAVETRERKEHVDLAGLRKDWRARAAEHGLGRTELAAALHRTTRHEPSSRELLDVAAKMLSPKGLTERATAFSDPDLVMAWAAAHEQGALGDRIRRLAERFSGTEGVERVGEASAPGRPRRYSTTELITAERRALALVDAARGVAAPTVSDEILEGVLGGQRGALSLEQAEMLRAVAGSVNRVVCVVGLAGSGKTTATRAVNEAFLAARVPIVGAAPSGVAADKLQDETGIHSTTLHGLLKEELPVGCLVVVDEAGMAETRVLAPLLDRVDQANGKVVLMGDPHQLPAVGAGGLFAGIVERHGAVELSENRRQHDPEERRALQAIRDGVGRDYLAFADGQGRLISEETSIATKARLLADWWASAQEDLPGSVMIALRRRDVAEFNALARTLMDTHGRLGEERLAIAEREFASGDRVVCLRNSDALGVKNGTRGTVDSIDRSGHTVTVSTDRGDRVRLTPQYLGAGHLRHAYALTGHSGQGVTVDRAFVLAAGDARLREWGYVALSRARTETWLYVTADARERESHFHDLDERGAVTQVAQALEGSAVERLAVDQRPLISGRAQQARPEIERSAPTNQREAWLRFIEQQRRAVLNARVDAQRKLGDAEQGLAKLKRFDRSGARHELQSKIALRREAIRGSETRLSLLEAQAQEIRDSVALGDRPHLSSPDHSARVCVPPAGRQVAEIGVEI
jgi:conjugative relaxase-like TrwC/TraI family protein